MQIRSDILTAELVYTAEIRAAAGSGAPEFDAVLVPYNTVIDLGWGEKEAFDPGSIEVHDQGLLVLWQHQRDEPIGKATEVRDSPENFAFTGRLSSTPAAVKAHTLLKDEVITRVSIGFTPVEYRVDEAGVIHWTKAIAREGSLVTFPAYDDAKVTGVRAAAHVEANTKPNTKENAMPPTASETVDLTELRATVTELSRSIDQLRGGLPAQTPAVDTRTAGEVLKALAAGDEATISRYEAALAAAGVGAPSARAYTGGVIADTVTKDAWIGDLTRLFDEASGVLVNFFGSDTLPATGMNLEFAELDLNTLVVAKQATEGAAAQTGKVKIKTRTTPVSTYHGGAELSRQEIERSTINLLNTTLRGLTIAAGATKKATFRTAYDTVVTARKAIAADAGVVTLGAALGASTSTHWHRMLVKAAIRYSKMNLTLDGLLVSENVFDRLTDLTVDGERVFVTDEGNHSGTLDLPGLKGRFASLPVALDPDETADSATFANKMALTAYDSAVTSLTDEAILALTKTFAVYRYGAVADEIPAAIVPVKLSA